MLKYRWYFDKDRETEWLNEMARKGYAMKTYFLGLYRFEECEPGEWAYQIDFTDNVFGASTDYRKFMQDMGVEVVCHWNWWVFLRKKAAEGPFELYTDVESAIDHYAKIRAMFKAVACINAVGIFLQLFGAVRGFQAGWIFASLLAAVVVVLARQIARTNEILTRLKARIGETHDGGMICGKKVSELLAMGLLLNAVALMLGGVSGEVLWGHFLRGALHALAIVLMTAGIVRTRW